MEVFGNYKIQFGEYDDALIKSVVTLFEACFDWTDKFSFEYIKWQYMDNPNGQVVSYNAFDENNNLAAHYAAIPIKMSFGNEIAPGLLSLNTATHPNHQGKKLFTKLATLTYEKAYDMGYKFVIGVANANSTHGFLTKLGFYFVAPLEVKIGIGDIYKASFNPDKFSVFYNENVLKWRLKCPGYKYSSLGNTIYGDRKEPMFHTCVAKMPAGLSRESLGLPKTKDIFNLYVGLGIDRKCCYFSLPKFIKRSPFNLIFKDLTNGEMPVVTKDNIVFQLMDFDVA